MERLEAIVRGRVQFVMFRDFTCRKARGLGLVGEVQNLSDGTVRVVAEGPHKKLEQLIGHLRRGPLLAEVTEVVPSWHKPTREFTRFSILYDRA